MGNRPRTSPPSSSGVDIRPLVADLVNTAGTAQEHAEVVAHAERTLASLGRRDRARLVAHLATASAAFGQRLLDTRTPAEREALEASLPSED